MHSTGADTRHMFSGSLARHPYNCCTIIKHCTTACSLRKIRYKCSQTIPKHVLRTATSSAAGSAGKHPQATQVLPCLPIACTCSALANCTTAALGSTLLTPIHTHQKEQPTSRSLQGALQRAMYASNTSAAAAPATPYANTVQCHADSRAALLRACSSLAEHSITTKAMPCMHAHLIQHTCLTKPLGPQQASPAAYASAEPAALSETCQARAESPTSVAALAETACHPAGTTADSYEAEHVLEPGSRMC
jgi:hypothetical protein